MSQKQAETQDWTFQGIWPFAPKWFTAPQNTNARTIAP